jgi:hypothetical protein
MQGHAQGPDMNLTGTLPGGYWDDSGQLHRDYELSMLRGEEEELLAATGADSAHRVSAVLARCLRRIGTLTRVDEHLTGALLVADRQYLLLHLRQAAFGDRVRAELICPWPRCGQRMSIDLSLADVPVTGLQAGPPPYTMTLSAHAAPDRPPAQREVLFRLPTGADQAAVGPLLAANPAAALSELLNRCVVRVGESGTPHTATAELTPRARAEIEAAMADVAPHVEDTMDTTCVECGRTVIIPFDLQRIFFGDLRADRDLLYREVHYLAFHYHWAERDIMAMTRDKRRAYIDLLAGEIDRLNDGV